MSFHNNKENIQYFESNTVRGLYASMLQWQRDNQKRLLSIGIHQEGDHFCCIALTNPSEVVITNQRGGPPYASVSSGGALSVMT